MKPVRILAIATVASFGMSTAVQAADPLPPLMVDIPAVAAEPSFGWGGFYVGAGIGGAWSSFPLTEFHLSVYVGGNFAIGTSMVAGAEIYATWFTPATFPWRIGGDGRVVFFGDAKRAGLWRGRLRALPGRQQLPNGRPRRRSGHRPGFVARFRV